jgi:aspartate carbamoyltransferase regulatory subunit
MKLKENEIIQIQKARIAYLTATINILQDSQIRQKTEVEQDKIISDIMQNYPDHDLGVDFELVEKEKKDVEADSS